ncbi:hypothetical protein [Paratractidigestivibacter sp.]|uniref:hypothetical protein n=1 Tax=Paratractidigestivibacter sp. TaxID=2847316 RepID=UPI002AC90B81|nr:hypothetical protein [Paratractidigestivibacter sp.]
MPARPRRPRSPLRVALALAALAVASALASALQCRDAEGIQLSYRLWSSVDPDYPALASMLSGIRFAESASRVALALSVALGDGSLVFLGLWAARRRS